MQNLTLREIRTKKKISRKQLAEQSKISEAYLSMIENGKRTPTVEVINNIANALNCKPNIIFLSLNLTNSKIKIQ